MKIDTGVIFNEFSFAKVDIFSLFCKIMFLKVDTANYLAYFQWFLSTALRPLAHLDLLPLQK